MGAVHIPRTATRRSSFDWAKALTRVRPNPESGFDFEGRFLRSGATVDEDQVFLAGRDPAFSIVLEYAGQDRSNPPDYPFGGGRKRFPMLYILWRCDRATLVWRELARASSFDSSWTADLGPIAIRALHGNSPPVTPDVEALCDRICWLLYGELELIEGVTFSLALDGIHHRIAAWSADRRPSSMGLGERR